MNDTIILHGAPVELTSDLGHEFTENCVRAGEGLIDDRELAEIYELSPADFQAISKDAALIRAIRTVRDRRVRTGQAAREAAAKHFVKAPGILDRIMSTESSNDRHKIEAIRELRQTAIPENQNTQLQGDRFIIQINLGGETEVYNKSIAIDPHDCTPLEQSNVLPLPEKRKRGRPRKVTVVPNNEAHNTITRSNKLTAEDIKFMQAFEGFEDE
jgi:hypothetical protein